MNKKIYDSSQIENITDASLYFDDCIFEITRNIFKDRMEGDQPKGLTLMPNAVEGILHELCEMRQAFEFVKLEGQNLSSAAN